MSQVSSSKFGTLAVIGAGNMGSGIAQKMATEGFDVVLVDVDDQRVQRGLDIIADTLSQGVERKIFKPEQAEQIRGRVRGTADWNALADVDLVVEAVFEDLEVKRQVFAKLDEFCRPDAILGTNTSSMSVTELAEGTKHPERVVGLHYFYHPAKNRLVEVVPGKASTPDAIRRSWVLQEQLGKTPIASADASGFVVNRFFVPWLNEAVRILEDGEADIPTIEAACKKTFGVGMGPFELMNVTGVPIALHAADTLARNFGRFYAPAARLRSQVDSGDLWSLEGDADASRLEAVGRRMSAVVFYVAAQLVDEDVSSIEDTDIGARVGLRWPRGPFQMINRVGVAEALAQVEALCGQWELAVPKLLADQAASGKPFVFRLVNVAVEDGIATLTLNRPDAMNALNEAVVEQLHAAFREADANTDVRGIVIAGAGKGFVAGADIRFFVKNIEAKRLDRIVEFTRAGQALLADIGASDKTVVARLDGLALGGGVELALACDRIVATPKASLAFPETGIGIYPGLGGTQRTPRRVGTALAKWLVFTGAPIGADDALAIGLVDRVVPHDELAAAIREAVDAGPRTAGPATPPERFAKLAALFDEHDVAALQAGVDTGDDKQLARAVKQVGFKAPIALVLSEKLIDGGHELPLDQALALELEHLEQIFSTEDAYEGLSSLGRRRPEYKGR